MSTHARGHNRGFAHATDATSEVRIPRSASTLVSLLPSWVTDGDRADVIDRLRDHRTTTRLELEHTTVDWTGVRIAAVSHPDLAELIGRTVAELASEAGQSAVEIVTDTLIADRLGTAVLTEA